MKIVVISVILCTFIAVVVSSTQIPTNGLYGLSLQTGLISIDPTTGVVKNIGPAAPYEAQAQGLSALDPFDNTYYIIGYNRSTGVTALVGFSLTDGKVNREVKLPFEQSAFVGVGMACVLDPKNGELIVMGRDASAHDLHHILRVNPKSGSIKSVGTIGNTDVLGGAATYDPSTGYFWVMLAVNNSIDIFAIDTATGKQAHKIPDALNLDTMEYDPKTGNIIGIGLNVVNETDFARTLVSLNPHTLSMKVEAVIPDYFIISGSVSAIDLKLRRIYVQMQPRGEKYFDLVGVDMDNGKVGVHPKLCLDDAECPWSMGHLNENAV